MPPEAEEEDEHYIEGCHGTLAEQKDEAFYDDRSDASDDMEKGRLKFPNRIYGRDRELKVLENIYADIITSSINRGDEDLGGGDANQEATSPDPYSEDEVYYDARGKDSEDEDLAPIYQYSGSSVVFLSGYSGIGKSALVNEFVKRIQSEYNTTEESAILYASGKYTEQKTASVPFSAISEVLESLASSQHNDVTSIFKSKIRESELIGSGTDGGRILKATFPALAPLFGDASQDGSSSSAHPSMNAIKECTREMLSIISNTLKHPLVLFLDDMQWGDGASMEMLTHVLQCTKLKNIMFICAYRSNEVDAEHSFTKLMEDVTRTRECGVDEAVTSPKPVERMDLFSLSPEAISKFIADSVKKEDDEGIDELAQAVYTKTMGNIFFTKQALEELLRKNVLFYDVMCFEWRWVVPKVELADSMSDDVVETVKGKITSLSLDIQHLLVVMAYIPNALDVPMLKALMSHWEILSDEDTIEDLLKEASEEGMLLLSVDSKCYVFAHDRIRQSSLEFAGKEDQTELLLHISRVLRDYANHGFEMNWCLYVAVDILNCLPSNKTSCTDLIKLNMRVAKIARSRGSLEKENELLHKGLDQLELSGILWKEYKLTLDLYDAVITSDHDLGSYSVAMLSVDKVLQNAKSLTEKLHAYQYQLMCGIEESSDYSKGLNDGIDILNRYGFDIPAKISKIYMMKEEAKLKIAMRNRSYSCLTKLPIGEEPIIELLMHVTKCAMYTAQDNMLKIMTWKAIQYSLKRGSWGKWLPMVMALLATSLANQRKMKTSQEIGNVSVALCDKIIGDLEIGPMTRFVAYANVLPKLQPFRSSIEPLLQCHKDLRLAGALPEGVLSSVQGYFESFFAAGLELNPLLEVKLLLVEELCLSLGRPGWLINFQIYRQFALNLRTRTANPTEFMGKAFHEENALNEMNPNARKMALRDSSSSRLQLAFVFRNEDVMAEMLERLRSYPQRDAAAGRLHNRLCFVGLAAFAVCKKKGFESFIKLGQDCLNYYEYLTKHGSVDGKPVYLFMIAMKKPSRDSFKKAIDACNEVRLVHLEAMANEHYAILLEEENDEALARDYRTSSYWLYQDWGAHAKALQMSKQYEFLKNSKRKDAKGITLSTAIPGDSAETIASYSFDTTSQARNVISIKK